MNWKQVRALWRMLRLFVLTAVVYPPLLVGMVVLPRTSELRLRLRRAVAQRWFRGVCAALGVRIEVEGELPPPGSFLVCNHLSYLDIPVIGSTIRTVFVSKAEVADWPIVGMLATSGGTIYVERQRKRQLADVNDSIAAALARGDGVVVFPEGTSTKGDDVLRFRPSLLAPAAEGAIAVRFASLSYRTAPGDPPASTHVCWWGDMAFAPHVRELLKLKRIEATLSFAPESVLEADRKVLSEKLWAGVKSRFRPVP